MRAAAQRAITAWSWLSSLILTGAVAAVIGFLLVKGMPAINMRLIFGRTPALEALLLRAPVLDGLWPAMAGTFFLVVTAVGLALPLGIGAGIYVAEYSRGRLKQGLTLLFDLLAGIPSIVVGLFGFSLTVFLHHHLSHRIYPSLLVSALALAFLVLPYLIRGTQAALGLAGAIMRGLWAEDRNIADADTLAAIATACGYDGDGLLRQAQSSAIQDRYERNTDEAIAAEVFGAPWYRVDGEGYWGQDRLDFVDRALAER